MQRRVVWFIAAALLACGPIELWCSGAASEAAPAAARAPAFSVYATFADWKAAVAKLPFNRVLKGTVAPRELLPLRNFAEFDEALDGFLAHCTNSPLSQTNTWVGPAPGADFFDPKRAYFVKRHGVPFQPFTQKLVVPPGARVFLHGDLHGDVHSLVAWLDWMNRNGHLDSFKLTKPDHYMLFLGDYTDRGLHGVEVIYTLLRLKLANPDRVYFARGNHEDVNLAINYGFLAEIQAKYGRQFNMEKTLRAYDFLPVVIYLGSGGDFIQCNHGGMEPGFDPAGLLASEGNLRFQLLGSLNQARFAKAHPKWLNDMEPASRRAVDSYLRDFKPETPTAPNTLGFMWNDFTTVQGEAQLAYDPGRAFVYGDRSAAFILQAVSKETARVRAVFRAHQHTSVLNPIMRRLKASQGVYRHWQEKDGLALLNAGDDRLGQVLEQSAERPIPPGSVWTFNVSPDSVYGEGCNFGFDTFGILKVAERFEDWRLQVVNVQVVK